MNNKTFILIKKDNEVLNNVVPKDKNLLFENLYIGKQENTYSYVASNAAGGGTMTGARDSFIFGFSVSNQSAIPMRVQFSIREIDKDGYSLQDITISQDIGPREKRRVESNFTVQKFSAFKSYIVKEIAVGATPQEDSEEIVKWSAITTPNQSIFEILKLLDFSVSKKRILTITISIVILYIIIAFILQQYHNYKAYH